MLYLIFYTGTLYQLIKKSSNLKNLKFCPTDYCNKFNSPRNLIPTVCVDPQFVISYMIQKCFP